MRTPKKPTGACRWSPLILPSLLCRVAGFYCCNMVLSLQIYLFQVNIQCIVRLHYFYNSSFIITCSINPWWPLVSWYKTTLTVVKSPTVYLYDPRDSESLFFCLLQPYPLPYSDPLIWPQFHPPLHLPTFCPSIQPFPEIPPFSLCPRNPHLYPSTSPDTTPIK